MAAVLCKSRAAAVSFFEMCGIPWRGCGIHLLSAIPAGNSSKQLAILAHPMSDLRELLGMFQ